MMSKVIKRCLLTLCLICVGFAAFANESDLYQILYKDAPEDIVQKIKTADELIAQKKYLSAVNSLGADDNEYIIYKKSQIYMNYYISTNKYKKFELRDLEDVENLDELRKNPNPKLQKVYDVPDVIMNFQRKSTNKKIPILYLALGNYYSELLNSPEFSSSRNSHYNIAKMNYMLAEQDGYYDEYLLYNMIHISRLEKNMEQMLAYSKRLVELLPNSPIANYEFAIISMQLKKYEDALKYGLKSLELEKVPDNIAFKTFFVADVYVALNKPEVARKLLLEAKQKFSNSAEIVFSLGKIYDTIDNNYEKAEEEFINAVKLNKSIITSVVYYLEDSANKRNALKFCTIAKTLHPEDNEYTGYANLLHAEACLVNMVSSDTTRSLLKESRKYFKKAGVLNKYEQQIAHYENACKQIDAFF